MTAFQDAGTAIHPDYVEGQIQGGTVQGIGWALNEEYFMGSDGGSDCKAWLATIGNNHGRQIINICYLVKVKGE